VTTIAVNVATANGLHCCNAAGNAGHDADPATSHLGAPADALSVITCGAVSATGVIASFSSDGPTADGRIKPEVLARGLDTRTVSATSDSDYVGSSGTSFSTPLVASAVACLVQAHPEWTVEQMRWYLTRTAEDYVANGTHDPLYVRGYGIIDATAAARGSIPIPTASAWGVAIMTLLVLIVATLIFRRCAPSVAR
jgi:subtilisin family serine protease